MCLVDSLEFSPNGRILVSSNVNVVLLWNMRGGAAKALTDANYSDGMNLFTSTVFSPDGRYVAGSKSDGMARIWDARTSQLLRRMKSHGDSLMYPLAFMPDGKGLVTPSLYWDVRSLYTPRCRSHTLDDSRVEEQTPEREFLRNDVRWFHSLSFGLGAHSILQTCQFRVFSFLSISPDGRWVASNAEGPRSVCIWDILNATRQCSLKHDSIIVSVDFSPEGRFLASVDISGALRIWRYSPRCNIV